MIRHSVVARHRDLGDSAVNAVSFASDDCLDYVPIRVPDTICVRDRLPPGAAAVLINPAHTYTDLFLPVDALELLMFEAIDGTRCIGDIVGDEKGRQFFERLWHHDQIVVDATSARCGGDQYVTRHHADSESARSAAHVSHALEADGRRVQS
jgi:hypothetical protein